jgi:hypothetical protein
MMMPQTGPTRVWVELPSPPHPERVGETIYDDDDKRRNGGLGETTVYMLSPISFFAGRDFALH